MRYLISLGLLFCMSCNLSDPEVENAPFEQVEVPEYEELGEKVRERQLLSLEGRSARDSHDRRSVAARHSLRVFEREDGSPFGNRRQRWKPIAITSAC